MIIFPVFYYNLPPTSFWIFRKVIDIDVIHQLLTYNVCCKALEKVKNTNKLSQRNKTASAHFPRGCKSLIRGVVSEVLASGNGEYRKVLSEGSQTAKVSTDEHVGLAVTG